MNPSRRKTHRQTENFLRLSMALKGVKKFWKRTFSSGSTLKINIQVFKSLMMKKLYKPFDPSSDINDADNEDQDFEDLRTISHTEGVQALATALKYLDQRSDITPIDLLFLNNWLDRAATDRNSGLLQRKVTDYFKK
ncbi:hypothetical protein AVEN_13583-1 [Araneus ventricosus]|uniref:Uncharacterized protein n=1 Tax=Araneus ventricosus TaxID=182803 RepID=A0A4Y2D704_ARAVE|nr:hypothetical protein AVEN_13583-1 [Araneus ventricosus]